MAAQVPLPAVAAARQGQQGLIQLYESRATDAFAEKEAARKAAEQAVAAEAQKEAAANEHVTQVALATGTAATVEEFTAHERIKHVQPADTLPAASSTTLTAAAANAATPPKEAQPQAAVGSEKKSGLFSRMFSRNGKKALAAGAIGAAAGIAAVDAVPATAAPTAIAPAAAPAAVAAPAMAPAATEDAPAAGDIALLTDGLAAASLAGCMAAAAAAAGPMLQGQQQLAGQPTPDWASGLSPLQPLPELTDGMKGLQLGDEDMFGDVSCPLWPLMPDSDAQWLLCSSSVQTCTSFANSYSSPLLLIFAPRLLQVAGAAINLEAQMEAAALPSPALPPVPGLESPLLVYTSSSAPAVAAEAAAEQSRVLAAKTAAATQQEAPRAAPSVAPAASQATAFYSAREAQTAATGAAAETPGARSTAGTHPSPLPAEMRLADSTSAAPVQAAVAAGATAMAVTAVIETAAASQPVPMVAQEPVTALVAELTMAAPAPSAAPAVAMPKAPAPAPAVKVAAESALPAAQPAENPAPAAEAGPLAAATVAGPLAVTALAQPRISPLGSSVPQLVPPNLAGLQGKQVLMVPTGSNSLSGIAGAWWACCAALATHASLLATAPPPWCSLVQVPTTTMPSTSTAPLLPVWARWRCPPSTGPP